MRTAEGKSEAIVLDHSGNVARFWSRVDDLFECGITELDDGKKKPKPKKKPEDAEKEMVKCPACKAMHMPRPSCPACGHEYPRKKAIEHVPGTLSELVATGNAAMMRRELWPQVVAIVREKGITDPDYVQRRSQAIYHELTGKFAHAQASDTPMALPSLEVRNRIKANQIRFAKGRQAAQRQGVAA
jgi:ribosomal protein L32